MVAMRCMGSNSPQQTVIKVGNPYSRSPHQTIEFIDGTQITWSVTCEHDRANLLEGLASKDPPVAVVLFARRRPRGCTEHGRLYSVDSGTPFL